MRLIDEQYTRTPFYGSRRITAWLNSQGYLVNRKRTQRLMGLMGIQADGYTGSRPKARKQPEEQGAQGLSLSASRGSGCQAKPGVEHGYHLLSDAAGVHVPGCHH